MKAFARSKIYGESAGGTCGHTRASE